MFYYLEDLLSDSLNAKVTIRIRRIEYQLLTIYITGVL